MSLFLMSELLDFDEEASIADLVACEMWDEIADRLCAGSVLHGLPISPEQAAWIASRLPDELRMDAVHNADGTIDWHVVKEGFAQ